MVKQQVPVSSPDIVSIISQRLGISFLRDREEGMEQDGNVCFAQSPELRPEYRDTFTMSDLIGYLYGIVYCPSQKELYPTDAKDFWGLVKIGNGHFHGSKNEIGPVQVSIEIHPVLKHNTVTFIKADDSGKIWINDLQYLTGIPSEVWELRLNGEYPVKKWLENHLGDELATNEMDQFHSLVERLIEVCYLFNKIDNPN